MKVKELIEQLQKYDLEQEVIIRFALDSEDEIGYILKPFHTDLYFKDEMQIVRPEVLTGEAIMKIANTKDEALIENNFLKEQIHVINRRNAELEKEKNYYRGKCNEFNNAIINFNKEDKQ